MNQHYCKLVPPLKTSLSQRKTPSSRRPSADTTASAKATFPLVGTESPLA